MQLSDKELIDEVRNRLAQSRLAVEDYERANRTLITMNERLRQSEALKSNFLSNIRNEINNPLHSIMGLATQIIWGLDDKHPLAQVAEVIREEAQNLNFQLANIITAADLESGEFALNLSQVNVTSMMEGTLDTFLPIISRKRLQIKWAGETEDPIIFVSDAEKLAILFANLLDNAIKFSNDKGEIHIDAGCHEDKLSIRVRDFGIGIQKRDQKRIFDPFFQLDSGSTRAHRGHGIGLSIVSALVDLLKGRLQLESAPGKGTDVTVLFPTPEHPESIDIFAEEGNLLIFGQDHEK